MRILEAFGEPIADGGQEAFVFGVLENIDMTGMTIDCLTAYDCRSERYKNLVERRGGIIYSLNLPFAPGKSRWNIKKPFREFLINHHYDVVHIHSGSISVLAIMAAEADRSGVNRVIVHSHVDGDKDNLKHRTLRLAASVTMKSHVDIYCACSKKAAEWKFEPGFAAQARIIKNGIDTERYKFNPSIREQVRRQLTFLDSFVIGHVGRFNYQKNHEFLINVFKTLCCKDPSSRLLLIGDGEEMDKIKGLVNSLGLEKRVVFTGSVTNVEDYLQAMDVFVFPSRYEGLGIAAIEAQCAGLPVIASDSVPREAKITDMDFVSLSDSYEKWADEILKYKGMPRHNNKEAIRAAGYDIKQTVTVIRTMYMQ